MTMVIIIARRNDFLLITDTRTEGNHPDFPNNATKKLYHDQSQKIFYSVRNRIGLAIAGNAVLVSSNYTNNS